MWMPKTEEEIENVVTGGALEEGPTFDAKRELPSNNKETAKDIAAMAVDGGVIIYGIDEDAGGRPTILHPISLAGQRERIESIARTAIQEPVHIQSWNIPTSEDPSKGYLVVSIPPSERAPHMVTKTNRYYGRKGTQNIPLTEGDVARLYERREQWKVNHELILREEIERAPIEPNERFAYLHIIARPVSRSGNIIEKAVSDEENLTQMLTQILEKVVPKTIYPRSYKPDFSLAYANTNSKRLVEGILIPFYWPENVNLDDPRTPGSILSLQVDFDGTVHLFCGGAGKTANWDGGTMKVLQLDLLSGITTRLLAFHGNLLERANYFGMVDIGLAITNLQDSVPYSELERKKFSSKKYDRDEYLRTIRISALKLKANPMEHAKTLLMPLFEAMTQEKFDPFPQ